MIVTQLNFAEVVTKLKAESKLGLDTETYGLRMYHGDRLFSIIIATMDEGYYFNFNGHKDHLGKLPPRETVLFPAQLSALGHQLFSDPTKTWFIQNAANFDLPVLGQDGLVLAGTIHCTKAIGRIVYNDRMSFSLETQLEEIGLKKSDIVKEYVETHKLFTSIKVPGKDKKVKRLHYDKVPFNIIAPYGELDGTGVRKLGFHQEKEIDKLDEAHPELKSRSIRQVVNNENRLQKTIYRMKDVGVQIDVEYCKRAIEYEQERIKQACEEFRSLTGEEYQASPLLFKSVFGDEKERWGYTDKGNPSFESDNIKRFNNPAAKQVLKARDAKSKSDFYHGFLYHADSNGVLHPDYNPAGTIHGRFSSSDPNFQNLTASEEEEVKNEEFIIRRAIVPRPGYVLIMPDYDQMEYKFALEMACRLQGQISPLGQKVLDGYDFHEATKLVTLEQTGLDYSRKIMKTANFLTLYGGGAGKLSGDLKISVPKAHAIRNAIKQAAPEIDEYIRTVIRTAEERGYIINWFGRRSHFTYKQKCYKAPNYIISGGCADVVKIAMNRCDESLLSAKSRLMMQVHDELVFEVHESEIKDIPENMHFFMENSFESKFIPLTVGMKWSAKSLGDTVKGYP